MERTSQEVEEINKDIKSKVDLLTSIDKRFLIKYIKQSIREEPKEEHEGEKFPRCRGTVRQNFR